MKRDLKLSDRVYYCKHCGTVIDRDLNASINLYSYGKKLIINH
ncbi:MAG: transposase [Synergistaceae bacterium]|nr:transposase [Synergistaceae bacterium]